MMVTSLNSDSERLARIEIQICNQNGKGIVLEVVGGLEGKTSQVAGNQGCNPTENIDMLPKLEGPSYDQHNIGASGRDARDESSLVGFPNSPLHEA